MTQPTIMSVAVEPAAGETLLSLWQGAVGRVFKAVSKPYGLRQVTYTQVRAVHEPAADGSFDVEVNCVEIIARVIEGKRVYSNICKEGVLNFPAGDGLPPECFGADCPAAEFGKVTGAILAYTNTYLEWVIQDEPEEETAIPMPLDLPHLRVSAMEASLLRHSPFLAGNVYFLTPNAVEAGRRSIRAEMARAARNIHLVDAVDPFYVEEKNKAAAILRARLEQPSDVAPAVAVSSAPAAVKVGTAVRIDSLCLALLGKPSATAVRWVVANPSEEGVVAGLGADLDPLEFVRWAHVTGRLVPAEQAAARNLRDFFRGWNNGYTGPDKDGIYPLLKFATE